MVLKLNCRPLAFNSYKAFLKTKDDVELVSLPHFLLEFLRKISTNFHCQVAFTS